MPNIKIYESDSTSVATNDITTVFVPGHAELVDKVADSNNCVYIPCTTTDFSKYFVDTDYNTKYAEEGTGFHFVDTVHLVEMLVEKGYGVIYRYIPEEAETVETEDKSTTEYLALDKNTFTENNFDKLLKATTFYVLDDNGEYSIVPKGTPYSSCEEVYEAGGYYYILATLTETQSTLDTDWDFLLDKNTYDVKFITTGTIGTVAVSKINAVTTITSTYYLQVAEGEITEDNFDGINAVTPLYVFVADTDETEGTTADLESGTFESATAYDENETYYIKSAAYDKTTTDSITANVGTQGTKLYGFNFSTMNDILPICAERKDCSLLVDLNYYDILNGVFDASQSGVAKDSTNSNRITYNDAYTNGIDINGNELAMDWKTALEYEGGTTSDTLTQEYYDTKEGIINLGSRAYSLVSNATMDYSYGKNNYVLTVPASFVYLYTYAEINKSGSNWRPLAGVQRAVIEGTFTPDLNLTKYYLDSAIITDGEGVSFNGIVTVRPYGYTIWGDRTLRRQDENGIMATSYFSIRNLVSDVAKLVYDTSITYTYETSNDATWLNFKEPITELLDSMTASGVLSDYKIRRRNVDSRNTMVAVITLYTRLPIENFEIFIDLQNAEVTVSGE